MQGRGVNRISAAGKHLRSREWHGVPRKEGTGARFVPGRGKCYGFAANRFTSHGRTGEGCRQNGRRAESAIIPRGKVLRFHGKSIHPPKNTTLHWQMLFMKIPGAAANC